MWRCPDSRRVRSKSFVCLFSDTLNRTVNRDGPITAGVSGKQPETRRRMCLKKGGSSTISKILQSAEQLAGGISPKGTAILGPDTQRAAGKVIRSEFTAMLTSKPQSHRFSLWLLQPYLIPVSSRRSWPLMISICARKAMHSPRMI